MSVPEPITLASDDGTPIALHHLGGENGAPPLLVSHATGFHGRCYLPLAPTLATRFDVWGLDYRGHGASRLDPGVTFSWDDFEHDLFAAIDHLGGRVHGFGHSLGAAMLMRAEARRPGSLAAAWLFEPIIFPGELGPRNSFMSEAALRRRSNFPSRADALARYASRPPLNTMRADALWSYIEYGFVDVADGTVELACRPEHEALTFNGAGTPVTEVAGVACPIVVAAGHDEPDRPTPAEFARGIVDAVPSTELAVYDRLTHFGPLEAPEDIAADAVSFLSQFD